MPDSLVEQHALRIPRLTTERLVLRSFEERDFEAYAEMMTDPEVTRHLGERELSRPDAWLQLAMLAGHWIWVQFLPPEAGGGSTPAVPGAEFDVLESRRVVARGHITRAGQGHEP